MTSRFIPFIIPAMEGVAKGPEKKGTTKDTKSTKKSFSFPLCSSCPSWFEAFMLFKAVGTLFRGHSSTDKAQKLFPGRLVIFHQPAHN